MTARKPGEWRPGDVLVRSNPQSSRGSRFLRLGEEQTGKYDRIRRIYVQACDGAGFLLDGKGHYVSKSWLASRYWLHRPVDDEDAS